MRRVRTAAGAARYKQPIGSIIIAQGGGRRPLNLSAMDDGDLMDLMHDEIAQKKNPDLYEVAAAEWSRRQPPIEAPDIPPYPDPWDEPDPTDTERLDMMTAERDAAFMRLDAEVHTDDGEWQDDHDRYQVYTALIAHEQQLAATNTVPQQPVPDVDETNLADGTADIEVSEATRKRWAIMDEADQLAQAEGISYEEALGRVEGLEPEQVRRREFVRIGQEKGYQATSFNKLVDEVHLDYQLEMEARMEAATSGHYIATEHKNDPEFWQKWNASGKTLFSMTDAEARKYLSPEARQFLDDNGGRVTKSDLVALIEDGKLSENFEPDSIQAAFSTSETRFSRGDYLQ